VKPFRVLFVCMGNICRSPAAAGTFRQLLKQEGVERHIECDSAGTIDYHTGAAPDARMRSAARERGITIAGSARQIAVEDLARFDLIL
jgi:protein-tyrosine phosphatase